jgi:hypothetical protein
MVVERNQGLQGQNNLLTRSIKLATDIQCPLLKCVYQSNDVITVIVIPQTK